MVEPRADYVIKVMFSKHAGEHPISVYVTSTRYKDGTEFHGKNIKPLLSKAAKWIEEK